MPEKAQRRRRSPEMAREEIIEATVAALEEVDFGSLTVDLIMQRTEMTRSSFYHYFKSVDEITLCFVDLFEEAIRAPVDDWLNGKSSENHLADTEPHLTDMFVAMDTHRTAMLALESASNNSAQVYNEWRDRIIGYFIEKTARFIRRQITLGRSHVTDPERTARALILMNNALANDNLLRAEPDDPTELGKTSAKIWNATIYDQ